MINSNIFYSRLESLWESEGYIQSTFSEKLGFSAKKVSSWRNSMPKIDSLSKILEKFPGWNPKFLIGLSDQKYLNPYIKREDIQKTAAKKYHFFEEGQENSPGIDKQNYNDSNKIEFVTVDQHGDDNIVLVNTKAAASYPARYLEPEYFKDLPAFSLPGARFRNGTFRCFEIHGDSMTPRFNNGDMVIAELEHDWHGIKDMYAYIIVTDHDVVCKRVINRIKERQRIRLKSDNPTVSDYEEDIENVRQVWMVKANITFDLSNPNFEVMEWLKKMENEIFDLREEVKIVKEANH